MSKTPNYDRIYDGWVRDHRPLRSPTLIDRIEAEIAFWKDRAEKKTVFSKHDPPCRTVGEWALEALVESQKEELKMTKDRLKDAQQEIEWLEKRLTESDATVAKCWSALHRIDDAVSEAMADGKED